MISHAVYHQKDEVLAQNVGISIARDLFDDSQDIEKQDVSFSWGTYGDSSVRLAAANLFLCFEEIPNNLFELKKITATSFTIEIDNLVIQAGDSIPTAIHSVEDISIYLRKYFDRYYDKLRRAFSRDFNSANPDANELDWHLAFTELHTPTYVYNKAVEYLDRYTGGKGLNPDDIQLIQVEIRKYLRKIFLGDD